MKRIRGQRWPLLLVLACGGQPTEPADRRSVLLSSGGVDGWRYELYDKDTPARFDTVIHVVSGAVWCFRFRVSQLTPDTLLALSGSPETGTTVFTATPIDVRSGPGWIWDGVAAFTAPAPLC
jgi:hypothetical protein